MNIKCPYCDGDNVSAVGEVSPLGLHCYCEDCGCQFLGADRSKTSSVDNGENNNNENGTSGIGTNGNCGECCCRKENLNDCSSG